VCLSMARETVRECQRSGHEIKYTHIYNTVSIMKTMNDIDKLLQEAETGKVSKITNRITEEAMPFWEGCEQRVLAGRQLKPYVVHRLLREQYGVKISESAVRNHFTNLVEHAK